jgi:hypothetical protein
MSNIFFLNKVLQGDNDQEEIKPYKKVKEDKDTNT